MDSMVLVRYSQHRSGRTRNRRAGASEARLPARATAKADHYPIGANTQLLASSDYIEERSYLEVNRINSVTVTLERC